MGIFDSEPGEKSFVEKHWLPLAALGIMAIVVAISGLGAEASTPPYMRDSGVASLITFITQQPFQASGGFSPAFTDIIIEAFFWLVLPILLVFLVLVYALETAFSSRMNITAPLALFLTLLVYASGQYIAFASLINAFGLAGLVGLFLVAILLILKTIKDLHDDFRR